MIVLGYLGALIIGIVLGLIGGGGSILTVPIFVYLLDVNPILATAYSLGVYIARAYLLDLIPNQILFFSLAIQKETVIMIFFAFIMFIASYFMIRGHREKDGSLEINYSNLILTFEGFIVGVLTGIVGAGGGFLIIPALILFAKLPMKKAVATSLMIIAIKSLFGFIGDLGNSNLIFDWGLLFWMVCFNNGIYNNFSRSCLI